MPGVVKTAISLDRDLFEDAEDLARELRVSRSRLIATALRDYVRRRHDRDLLERLNVAYAAPPSDEEQTTLEEMQRHTFQFFTADE
jgi:metal-responsive CopG/Arc/MetJ family transcriptional regulator